jgi:flagellar hook-associated protein 2
MTTIGGNIVSTLSGSDSINTSAIVDQLVSAARDPKQSLLNSRVSDNNARISALASAASALDTFSSALVSAAQDSAFKGQPASNDPSIAAVSAMPGGTPQGLPAQIEVKQLASPQILESINLSAKTQPVGLGTFTLTTKAGGASPQTATITIDSSNNTLQGLADAINGAKAGVTATIVTDNRGSRLVLKGETGDTNAFTLTKGGTDTADADLSRFLSSGNSVTLTQRQSAQDSIVLIDGVEMQNDSNVLTTALPYVRIDLNKAAPGTTVTLATDEPTKNNKDLVNEFVTAYNTLRSALNRASVTDSDASQAGVLAGDSAVREMKNQLAKLTTTQLASSGPYKTLNDLGVKTNKDGTLSIDTARLDAAIAADPGAVSRMLNPAVSTASDPGLAASVKKVRDSLQDTNGSLNASKTKYAQLQKDLTAQLAKLDKDMSNYQDQLSTVYTKLATQLNAFKATQSYLKQQVDLWTNGGNK